MKPSLIVMGLAALVCCNAMMMDDMDMGMDMGMSGPMMEPAQDCEGTAVYEIVFDFTWSSASHPTDYPSGSAHWSPVAGTTHSAEYRMWGEDLLATPGVQSVAETGGTSTLLAEIQDCGDDCSDMFRLSCSAFSGTCVSSGEIEVTTDRPYFSAVSMIAPSPDWFVGVHDLMLCKGGEWIPSYTTDLLPYDSDTDLGTTYRSPNQPNADPGNIFQITGEDSVVYHPTEMMINSFGTFTITLKEIM
eukprot:TRINITY_DN2322_c0_g1_i1.p1 TRINITY_DN2322_c0_g1~~TRINITY_DN2322_c0_g1_i1.p1  ORF type:complete len:245 (+),score=35.75 TRINITY_DN2322_c0_g1_i1:259-993(+)